MLREQVIAALIRMVMITIAPAAVAPATSGDMTLLNAAVSRPQSGTATNMKVVSA
jgi:hypothetical protein